MAAYRDALDQTPGYTSTIEQLQTLREKKKALERGVQSSMSGEWDEVEGLKLRIAQDKELLSDLAMNVLVKGETVAVRDEREQEYEPQFIVKFKRKE